MAKMRLGHIDGLRGVAALMVVLGHWCEVISHRSPDAMVSGALSSLFLENFSTGRLGIVAFFCISGFVVPFSFRGAQPLASFVVSRFCRLYPAYWLSMLIAILAFPFISDIHFSAAQIIANATMAPRLLGQPDMLGVYWTLLIELMFYGVCFVLFATGQLHRAGTNFALMLAFLAIAVLGGLYRWRHPASDLPIGIPTYLAAMHFGTLARLRLLEGNAAAARLYPIAAPLLAAMVVLANSLAYYRAHNELVGWVASNTGYLAGLALFLLCVHRFWFAGRRFAFLGLISYSVYLLHPIFLQWVVDLWPRFTDWRMAVAVLTPLLFGGSTLSAIVAQRLVEAPMVRVGRRIDRVIENLMMRRHPKLSQK